MKAIILAGGYGIRLGKMGENLPKPLLPLTDEMTVIDNLLKNIRAQVPEEDIVIVTNTKFEPTFRTWAEEKQFKGSFVIEPHKTNDEKFGTIRGLAWTIQEAKLEDDVLVLASDNVIHPFDDFLKFMTRIFDGKSAVVGAFEMGEDKIKGRFGNLAIEDDHRVTAFVEKPEVPVSPYASMAAYIFPKKVGGVGMLEILHKYLEKGNPDAPGHFLAYLVKEEHPLLGCIFGGKWWDVGKIDDWKSANHFFTEMLKTETK
ncbi:MAG: NTP transferase domain-containing protein [Candidatus Altiarchaeota archaeon]|nr:NTP transferase domain-containing protein [Candidatus Altiarchaeota archaeon]